MFTEEDNLIEEEGDHEEGYKNAYVDDFDRNKLDIHNEECGEQVMCIL